MSSLGQGEEQDRIAQLEERFERLERIVRDDHARRIKTLEDGWESVSSELRKMTTWVGQLADAATVSRLTTEKIHTSVSHLIDLVQDAIERKKI